MVTSCKWQRLKVLTPEGDASKVVYLIGQSGRQQLELAGKTMTTALSTKAARLEFVTIQEALLAQRPPQEEELVAQFIGCEEALLDGALQLKPPFDPDNVETMELVVAPFVVFYFKIWSVNEEEEKVSSVPISLFNGLVAPKVLEVMQQFPLATTGVSTVISPNIGLDEAFKTASDLLEIGLSSPETGRSSLIWCDTAEALERHQRVLLQDNKFGWEHLLWQDNSSRVLGVMPVEYVNAVLLLVPHLLLSLREPVQATTTALLDPILQNVYLMRSAPTVKKI